MTTTSSARSAGFTILAIAVLSGVGNFVAVQPLADTAMTATELTNGGASLRLGIAALSVVVVLDVVVSFALFNAFQPAGSVLMRMTSALRIAYAAGFALAISQLVPIARHLDGDLASASAATRRAGVEAGVERFNDVWHVALLLFGLHLVGLAIATWRIGMPRPLVILLAIAGGGYVFDCVANVVTGTAPAVSAYTFIGEFTLALWLVTRRRRPAAHAPQPLRPQAAMA